MGCRQGHVPTATLAGDDDRTPSIIEHTRTEQMHFFSFALHFLFGLDDEAEPLHLELG